VSTWKQKKSEWRRGRGRDKLWVSFFLRTSAYVSIRLHTSRRDQVSFLCPHVCGTTVCVFRLRYVHRGLGRPRHSLSGILLLLYVSSCLWYFYVYVSSCLWYFYVCGPHIYIHMALKERTPKSFVQVVTIHDLIVVLPSQPQLLLLKTNEHIQKQKIDLLLDKNVHGSSLQPFSHTYFCFTFFFLF
jgi:hypothetical protein